MRAFRSPSDDTVLAPEVLGPRVPDPRARRAPGRLLDALPRGRARRPFVVVVDNYDSFSGNLAHLLAQLGPDVAVVRNDAVTVEAVMDARPVGVVVSPGPHTPKEAGVSLDVIRACAQAGGPFPLLGVCLGHQAVGVAFGGRVVRAKRPVHGRATTVVSSRRGWLAALPGRFVAARYHSLVVDPATLPPELEVLARSAEGEIMALRHRALPIVGVQFHPESYLTRTGPALLAAFLRAGGLAQASSDVVR